MATMNSSAVVVKLSAEELAELKWQIKYAHAIEAGDAELIEELLLEETDDLSRTVFNGIVEAELYETKDGVQRSKFARWADGSLTHKRQMKSALGLLKAAIKEFEREVPMTQDELLHIQSEAFKGIMFPSRDGYLVSLKERFARNQVWSMVGRYLNSNYWMLVVNSPDDANRLYGQSRTVLEYLKYWNSVVDQSPSLEEMWLFYNKPEFEFKYELTQDEVACIAIQAEYTGKSEEDIVEARSTAQKKVAEKAFARNKEFYDLFGDDMWLELKNVLENEELDELPDMPKTEVTLLSQRMEAFTKKELDRQDSAMNFSSSEAVISMKGANFILMRGERYRLMANNAVILQLAKQEAKVKAQQEDLLK